MHHQARKFGLLSISTGQDAEIQTDHFVQSLAKLGVTLSARLAYASPVTIDAVGLVAKLKAAGVTSVIFSGDPVAPGPLTRAATSQNYFPEWIISGAVLTDTAIVARTYDQTQWSHTFAISFLGARTNPPLSGSTHLTHAYQGSKPHAAT